MRPVAAIALLVALTFALPAQAAPKKAAKVPQQTENPLFAQADQGEPEAQHRLGLAYRDGRGVKADGAVALSWLGLAAANGSVAAALDAAVMLERGQGVKADATRAGEWLYRAALLGDDGARRRWVGKVLSGELTSLGGQTGAEWIADAARAGDLRAPMILADAFERGLGVAVNEDAVEGWLRLAITLTGDVEAQFRLGRLLLARDGAWRVPTSEEWVQKDAERKSVPFGAVWYGTKPAGPEEKILVMRPGLVEGERRLKYAARAGHAEAQHLLGQALVEGMELPLDLATGALWLEAAASQGHPDALMALAGLAAKGYGLFAKDPVRAYVLFDLAAQAGEDGAAQSRDVQAKTLTSRQLTRAKQMVQGFRELQGL